MVTLKGGVENISSHSFRRTLRHIISELWALSLQVKAGYADIPRDVLKGITLCFEFGSPTKSREINLDRFSWKSVWFSLWGIFCVSDPQSEIATSPSQSRKIPMWNWASKVQRFWWSHRVLLVQRAEASKSGGNCWDHWLWKVRAPRGKGRNAHGDFLKKSWWKNHLIHKLWRWI